MSKYNKNKIAKLFDDKFKEELNNKETSIKQIITQIAIEQLDLNKEDILLDVGTGTGDNAINSVKICKQVIGIDISKKSLEKAKEKAKNENINNVIFAYGAFEEPCAEIDLTKYNINKILAIYSLHHLPDKLKKKSLITLSKLLTKLGRIVIGDIMFFEDPEKHMDKFDEVYYDDEETDFPSNVDYLTSCFGSIGAKVNTIKIHPLAGVIIADFNQ